MTTTSTPRVSARMYMASAFEKTSIVKVTATDPDEGFKVGQVCLCNPEYSYPVWP